MVSLINLVCYFALPLIYLVWWIASNRFEGLDIRSSCTRVIDYMLFNGSGRFQEYACDLGCIPDRFCHVMERRKFEELDDEIFKASLKGICCMMILPIITSCSFIADGYEKLVVLITQILSCMYGQPYNFALHLLCRSKGDTHTIGLALVCSSALGGFASVIYELDMMVLVFVMVLIWYPALLYVIHNINGKEINDDILISLMCAFWTVCFYSDVAYRGYVMSGTWVDITYVIRSVVGVGHAFFGSKNVASRYERVISILYSNDRYVNQLIVGFIYRYYGYFWMFCSRVPLMYFYMRKLNVPVSIENFFGVIWIYLCDLPGCICVFDYKDSLALLYGFVSVSLLLKELTFELEVFVVRVICCGVDQMFYDGTFEKFSTLLKYNIDGGMLSVCKQMLYCIELSKIERAIYTCRSYKGKLRRGKFSTLIVNDGLRSTALIEENMFGNDLSFLIEKVKCDWNELTEFVRGYVVAHQMVVKSKEFVSVGVEYATRSIVRDLETVYVVYKYDGKTGFKPIKITSYEFEAISDFIDLPDQCIGSPIFCFYKDALKLCCLYGKKLNTDVADDVSVSSVQSVVESSRVLIKERDELLTNFKVLYTRYLNNENVFEEVVKFEFDKRFCNLIQRFEQLELLDYETPFREGRTIRVRNNTLFLVPDSANLRETIHKYKELEKRSQNPHINTWYDEDDESVYEGLEESE